MVRRILTFIVIALVGFSLLGAVSAAHAQGELIPVSELGPSIPIPKPGLSARGGTLILSDSPEQLSNEDSLPAVMYRDRVEGIFRVFYHHQNISSTPLTVGIAVTNHSNQRETVFATGQGEGVNYYPDVAGQEALAEFIRSEQSAEYVATLQPGQTYWTTETVSPQDTISGIREFVAVISPGHVRPQALPPALFQELRPSHHSRRGSSDDLLSLPQGYSLGSVTVSTVAYATNRPSDPTSLRILPGDTHTRGTFPHFDRVGRFDVSTSNGLQTLAVDTAAPGHKYSNPMPGEYELGYDAVDGNKQVYNNGNYGVMYYFEITLRNDNPSRKLPFALLMQPSGGSGHYVMQTNGDLATSPFVSYKDAWWFYDTTLKGSKTRISLETSLPGGAAGPQKLYFYPDFNGQ